MFKKSLLSLFIVAALSGCYDGTADGTSPGALTESLGKMITKQPQEAQMTFAEDVFLLQRSFNLEQLQTNLDGKNAQQISTLAAALRSQLTIDQQNLAEAQAAQQAIFTAQRKLIAIAAIKIELSDLSQKMHAENNRTRIHVANAGFTAVENEITSEFDPIISFSLTNNGSPTIYSAILDGVLIAPNSESPVHSGSLEIEIEQGLPVGETHDIQFKPSIISDWRSVSAPDGSVLTLTIKDTKDKMGGSLIKGLSFSSDDDFKYRSLMQQLMELDPESFTAQAESMKTAPISVDDTVEALPVPVAPTQEAAIADETAAIEEMPAQVDQSPMESEPTILPETLVSTESEIKDSQQSDTVPVIEDAKADTKVSITPALDTPEIKDIKYINKDVVIPVVAPAL